MSQSQRTSSPVPDSFGEAFSPPEGSIREEDARNENQFAALGLSKDYPEVIKYLRERQEIYRKYLPDGRSIAEVPDDEAGRWWKCAATIIQEIEAFINIIEVSKDALRATGR